MLQLDCMTNDGRIESQNIIDEGYRGAMRAFQNAVNEAEYQLVYLWLHNEEVEGDRVVIEKWVRDR